MKKVNLYGLETGIKNKNPRDLAYHQIIKTDVIGKAKTELMKNEEYKNIVETIKDYEEHIYDPKFDDTFYDSTSYDWYDEDGCNQGVSYDEFDKKIYDEYVNLYENYEEITNGLQNALTENQNKLDELNAKLQKTNLNFFKRHKLKKEIQITENQIYDANNKLHCNQIKYNQMVIVKEKEKVSAEYETKTEEIKTLFKRAEQLEKEYYQQAATEAVNNNPFMINYEMSDYTQEKMLQSIKINNSARRTYDMIHLGIFERVEYSRQKNSSSHLIMVYDFVNNAVKQYEQAHRKQQKNEEVENQLNEEELTF